MPKTNAAPRADTLCRTPAGPLRPTFPDHPKDLFGTGLRASDKLPRVHRQDPYRHIPWEGDPEELPSGLASLLTLLVVLAGFLLGLLWEVL